MQSDSYRKPGSFLIVILNEWSEAVGTCFNA
jgi:hypothetical protein